MPAVDPPCSHYLYLFFLFLPPVFAVVKHAPVISAQSICVIFALNDFFNDEKQTTKFAVYLQTLTFFLALFKNSMSPKLSALSVLTQSDHFVGDSD